MKEDTSFPHISEWEKLLTKDSSNSKSLVETLIYCNTNTLLIQLSLKNTAQHNTEPSYNKQLQKNIDFSEQHELPKMHSASVEKTFTSGYSPSVHTLLAIASS